jgi:hypothetical protein
MFRPTTILKKLQISGYAPYRRAQQIAFLIKASGVKEAKIISMKPSVPTHA